MPCCIVTSKHRYFKTVFVNVRLEENGWNDVAPQRLLTADEQPDDHQLSADHQITDCTAQPVKMHRDANKNVHPRTVCNEETTGFDSM